MKPAWKEVPQRALEIAAPSDLRPALQASSFQAAHHEKCDLWAFGPGPVIFNDDRLTKVGSWRVFRGPVRPSVYASGPLEALRPQMDLPPDRQRAKSFEKGHYLVEIAQTFVYYSERFRKSYFVVESKVLSADNKTPVGEVRGQVFNLSLYSSAKDLNAFFDQARCEFSPEVVQLCTSVFQPLAGLRLAVEVDTVKTQNDMMFYRHKWDGRVLRAV